MKQTIEFTKEDAKLLLELIEAKMCIIEIDYEERRYSIPQFVRLQELKAVFNRML